MDEDAPSHRPNYAAQRFRSIDQRVMHWLEARLALAWVEDLVGAGAQVLDMPSGCGRFTQPLLRRGYSVSAADARPERLHMLRERVGDEVPRRCAWSDDLPYGDDAFDVSLCVRLLQHLRDPGQRVRTLGELARVSRAGVVVTVYMTAGLHRVSHAATGRKKLHWADAEGFAVEAAEAGLRIQRMARPIPWLHAQTVCQLVPRAMPGEAGQAPPLSAAS